MSASPQNPRVRSGTTSKSRYGPRIRTRLPGPKARAVVKADEKLLSPSYTRSYPLVAKRGRGVRLEDVDGNEFLDFAAGIAVCSTGHCHPRVVAALKHQAAELIHISGTDFYFEPMVELARRLSAIAPMPGPHRVYYGNSGAEAIEAAIKLARYHTGRQQFLAFEGAFHGRTMGALALTASKPGQRRRFFPVMPGVTHAPYPRKLRDGSGERDAAQCIRYIEETLFRTMLPPEEIAAIFVEPIQGEGGYVPAPATFLRELRRIATEHGILLVDDEIQSGVGRTGRWWAIEESGVEPDILCIAKGIASGMPLGVCMARAELMDWRPGAHASTFGGNPLAIAAALATMDILEREGLSNAAKTGEFLIRKLRDLANPVIGEVRGRGLMIGIDIQDTSGKPAPDLRDRIVHLAFEHGLLVLGCGVSTIRLCPPLIVKREEADAALEILKVVMETAARR